MKFLLIASLVMVLAACSEDKKKKGGGDDFEPAIQTVEGEIPSTLAFVAPESRPLQDEDIQKLSEMLKSEDPYDIENLILGKADESAEDREARLQKRHSAPKAVRDLIAKIDLNCGIKAPTSQTSESGSGLGAKRTNRKASAITLTSTACPLSADAKSTIEMTLLAGDANNAEGRIMMESDNKFHVWDDEARLTVGTGQKNLKMSLRGPFHWNPHTKRERYYLKGTGSGRLVLANGETYDLEAQLQMLLAHKGGLPQKSELLVTVMFNRENVRYVLTKTMKQVDGRAEVQTFLNGQQVADDLFGNFLGLSSID
jgi:hypothetical protein